MVLAQDQCTLETGRKSSQKLIITGAEEQGNPRVPRIM